MSKKGDRDPHISFVRRQKMIEQCVKWTQKDSFFPHDFGLNFPEMSNRELSEYHSCYEWALDEKNFQAFHKSTEKGG